MLWRIVRNDDFDWNIKKCFLIKTLSEVCSVWIMLLLSVIKFQTDFLLVSENCTRDNLTTISCFLSEEVVLWNIKLPSFSDYYFSSKADEARSHNCHNLRNYYGSDINCKTTALVMWQKVIFLVIFIIICMKLGCKMQHSIVDFYCCWYLTTKVFKRRVYVS